MRDNIYMVQNYGSLSSVCQSKGKLINVTPGKYVYHLTEGGNKCDSDENLMYRRLSIYLYGLLGAKRGTGGVWANRSIYDLHLIYPAVIDCFSWGSRFVEEIENQDVWRIDTRRISNKWYLDPNMQDDPFMYHGHDYLYTPNCIPPYALKLYKIKVNRRSQINTSNKKLSFCLIPLDVNPKDFIGNI